MADVGIDLGTTNSAIAHLRGAPQVIENQGRQTTPSAVAIDDGEIVVGQAAKDQAMVLHSVLAVKREMGTDKRFDLGGKSYTPEDVSSMILMDLIKAAEKRLGEGIQSAVITIPAYFSGAQKEATKRAGELAGVKSVRLLAEPIAAALAFGAEDIALVYDLGGGTFDVAIIDCFDYTMLALDGDNYLGGDDFDKRLIAHLAKVVKKDFGVDIESNNQAYQMARNICERAKIELSERQQTKLFFQCSIDGKLVNVNMKLTREEFESLVRDLVDRTFEKVNATIAMAAQKREGFKKEDIQTVLLVGGSTYVPLVRRRVKEFFEQEPSQKVSPDLAVALGAAIHTATGPMEEGVHRLRLSATPAVTASTKVTLRGRTSPNSKLEASGGASGATATAEASGRFSMEMQLKPDVPNSIEVVAISPRGERSKVSCDIRHDSNWSGEEKLSRVEVRKVGGGLTPRALGIDVTGQDNRLGVIIPAQTDIPCVVHSRDYGITCTVPNQAGAVMLNIYEGDLPYAPFNTLMASLRLETPAAPSTMEPVDIAFQITDDHLLTVTARMINYPDRLVTATIDPKSPSGKQLHVVERTDRALNALADKLRPEEKARINKYKHGLLDASEQYRREPKDEKYVKVKEMGNKLREELDRIDANCASA